MFSRSPILYFVIGALWLISAVLLFIEHPVYIGSVFWPSILTGIAGICFCVYAITLIVKRRE